MKKEEKEEEEGVREIPTLGLSLHLLPPSSLKTTMSMGLSGEKEEEEEEKEDYYNGIS